MIQAVDVQHTIHIIYRAVESAVPDRGMESMVQSTKEEGSIYTFHYFSWCKIARCIYSHR